VFAEGKRRKGSCLEIQKKKERKKRRRKPFRGTIKKKKIEKGGEGDNQGGRVPSKKHVLRRTDRKRAKKQKDEKREQIKS